MQVHPEILARCRKNDRKAHNELYRLCFGYLMSICLRYCNNREDAEGYLNQGFLKIITNLDKYKEEIPFGSWIARVMVNTIIDDFRRDKKRREHMTGADIDEVPFTGAVDFNDAAQELEAEELRGMIQRLPAMSQKVFNLYAIDGYSHKEIGAMLEISDGTSKWHVSFARKSLQEMIKKAMKRMMTLTL
ncbi:MAG: RNA polymerase sigma factor [Flavobacteriales bacterium]|nr:RNA polymerase sigma factor [Flavobacteriales bacterium]